MEEHRLYKHKPKARTNSCFSFSNLDVFQCVIVMLDVPTNAYYVLYLHKISTLGFSGKCGNLRPNSISLSDLIN